MPNHQLPAVDAANFLPRKFPPLVAQVLFGLALALAMSGLRTLSDIVAPNAGPFALVYPMVLIATLFGRLLAVQFEEMWSLVNRAARGGLRFDIVEAGAGNGRLS